MTYCLCFAAGVGACYLLFWGTFRRGMQAVRIAHRINEENARMNASIAGVLSGEKKRLDHFAALLFCQKNQLNERQRKLDREEALRN